MHPMKKTILILLALMLSTSLFSQIVFAQAEAEYIEKEFNRWAGDDSYSTVLNEDVYLQILVTDVTDSLGKSSQILSFYKKNIDNSFSFIGSMESIALGIEDYGEGLQFIYKHNNFIVIQQSFGAGRFLIISKLYLDFENDNTIKLVRYTEEHINRFIEDKDFAEIEYEIPNNIYLNNITRDTVYKLRQSKTKPWWEDSNGQAITKALVGDEVYLCFDVRYRAYADDVDGAPATIKIVEKDADGKDDPVTTLSAVVSGGKIKCQWQVTYTADDDDADSLKELEEKGYTLPEYAFVVECGGATSGESGVLEVYADFIAKLSMNGKLLRNYPYILKLADGSCRKGQTNSEGYITENELPVGKVKIL